MQWPQFPHQTVDDAPCWTAAEQRGQLGMARRFAHEGGTVQAGGGGFRAAQIGCTHLHACSAQRHGGTHAGRIGNAACSNHRYLYCLDHLGQQRKSAQLRAQFGTEKHAAVTTGFQPLSAYRPQTRRSTERGAKGTREPSLS